jgi:hypothetical protein
MPAKAQAESVGSVEDFVKMPWETTSPGESAEDAGRSLFDAMESEGLEFEDIDQPSDNEPPAATREREPATSDAEDADETEDADLEDEDPEQPEDTDSDADEVEDEEAGGEDEPDAELIEVTLPGGEKAQVTLDELRAGYSRTADYTRKRQRDATEHAEALESLRGIRETYDAKLGKLDELLQNMGPPKPTAELRQKNPGEYAAQKAEYEEFQAQLAAVGTERGSVDEERQREFLTMRDEIIEGERQKLLAAVPEWRTDGEKARTELAELAEFLETSYGFTRQQIDTVADHRLILMAREAMAARKRTAKAKKTLEGKKQQPRRVPAGARKRRSAANPEAQRVRERMAQRGGSLRDAAKLYELESGDDL